MPDGNPLVAQAKTDGDGPGPFTAGNGDYGYAGGIGIAESAIDTFNGIKDGNWVEGGLGMLGLAAEAASAAIDPFGWLMSSVASFLMEHVQPLKDMLDSLAGDPPVIQSYAETWGNISKSLGETHQSYTDSVKKATETWSGTAAQSYAKSAGEHADALSGAATVAGAISTVTMIMGEVVAFVRETVRDLIADLVGKLISWVMEEVFSLGFGTPVVVAQAVAAISKWGTKIADLLRRLLGTIRRVSPMLGKLADVFTKIIKVFGKLAGKVTGLDVISPHHVTPGGFLQRGGRTPDVHGPHGGGGSDGGGSDGSGSNGTGSNGSGPDGTGSGANGSGANGSGSNGTGSNRGSGSNDGTGSNSGTGSNDGTGSNNGSGSNTGTGSNNGTASNNGSGSNDGTGSNNGTGSNSPGSTPDTATRTPGSSSPSAPDSGTPHSSAPSNSGTPHSQTLANGSPSTHSPDAPHSPFSATPTASSPSTRTPDAPSPTTPDGGTPPPAGSPHTLANGSPSTHTPSAGTPDASTPHTSAPSAGTPPTSAGTPTSHTPSVASPSPHTPAAGSPSHTPSGGSPHPDGPTTTPGGTTTSGTATTSTPRTADPAPSAFVPPQRTDGPTSPGGAPAAGGMPPAGGGAPSAGGTPSGGGGRPATGWTGTPGRPAPNTPSTPGSPSSPGRPGPSQHTPSPRSPAPNAGTPAPNRGTPGQHAPNHAGPASHGPTQGAPHSPNAGAHNPGLHTPNQAGPNSHAPNQHAPNHGTPGSHAPNQHTPNQAGPGPHAPNQHTPNHATPGSHSPNHHTPNRVTPGPHAPNQHAPHQSAPSSHAPNQGGPGAHVPNQRGPQAPHAPNQGAPHSPSQHGPNQGTPHPAAPHNGAPHAQTQPGPQAYAAGPNGAPRQPVARGFDPGTGAPSRPGPSSPGPHGPAGDRPGGTPHDRNTPTRPQDPNRPRDPNNTTPNTPRNPNDPTPHDRNPNNPNDRDPNPTDPNPHDRDPNHDPNDPHDPTDPDTSTPDRDPLPPDQVNHQHAEGTPAGTSYHRGDPEMGDLPQRVHPDPDGRYTVDVHVTPDGHARIGGRDYTPEEFADILRRNGDYDGRPIRLIGCDAGSNDFANRLSRELDTPVLAPDRPAWTDSNGRVFSSDYETRPDGTTGPRIPPNGEWSVHHPDGTTTHASDDGFAHDTPDSHDVDGHDAQARGDDPDNPQHQLDDRWREPRFDDSEDVNLGNDQSFFDPTDPPRQLEPRTRYRILDENGNHRSTVYTDRHGNVSHVDSVAPNTLHGNNPEIARPAPNADYRVEVGHRYDVYPTGPDGNVRTVTHTDVDTPHGTQDVTRVGDIEPPPRVADTDHVPVGPDHPLSPEPNEPFHPDPEQLEPNHRYHVTDRDGNPRGSFQTDGEGNIRWIDTPHHTDTWRNPDLEHPIGDANYRVDRGPLHQEYHVDEHGRPERAVPWEQPRTNSQDPIPHDRAVRQNESFAARHDPSNPDTRLAGGEAHQVSDVHGQPRGTFYTNEAGEISHVDTTSGQRGLTNPEVRAAPPGAQVTTDGHYGTRAANPVQDSWPTPDRELTYSHEQVGPRGNRHAEGFLDDGGADLTPEQRQALENPLRNNPVSGRDGLPPNSRIHILDTNGMPHTTVQTGPDGTVTHVHTYQPFNPDLNNPPPNAVIRVDGGEEIHRTNTNGDTIATSSQPNYDGGTDLRRYQDGQSMVGAQGGKDADGKNIDDGGHHRGTARGGSGEMGNQSTQGRIDNSNVGSAQIDGYDNSQTFYSMERAQDARPGSVEYEETFTLREDDAADPHTRHYRAFGLDEQNRPAVYVRSFPGDHNSPLWPTDFRR
jgi:hypothetical protein